ncbi:Por secretion system C-terminal sorting domain-containing protein [Polaribacter sp. KT25b]|uniref:leucine-rich repeat protein n=1 Tax=Polaribacter sp. KT25b TaxID=1855336 RepID=UPI00087D3569|nr:leucine-rich repeat protein [Polaribacter sp. KT25b]SDS58437.1 Por secretion system C-terminal sorting domain-containing protein [Polaribacter sp. KT25b]
MKKRILLLIVMLLTIAITNAQQASGTQFTVGDMIYEVNADNTTVSVHDAVTPGTLTGAIVVPTHISDGSYSYTITVIKSAAYNDEAGITSLVVQGDTEIQLQAFRNTGLTTVDVSAIVTKKIGNSAFLNCTALTSANFDGVTSIGNQIFSGCTNLTTFSANTLVSSGGGTSMFLNCTSLTTVNLPVALAVGNKMFRNCTSLTTIDMPKAITGLQYGFQNCNALTTINLPLLETTGTQMFVDCSSLVSLDLPALTQTGNLSFYKCSSLKYLNLPSLITANTGSFNSTGLESIIFPASFTTFGSGPSNHFANAASLKHIAFTSATPVGISGRSDMFNGTALSTIIVPEGAASAYDAADVWTDFSIVEGTLSKTATDITYSRNLSVDDDWFLVSSPVNNEMFNDAYVSANSIDAAGTITTNNAIATYTTNGNTWDYMQDGEDLQFTPGVGYSVKRANATGAGSISFTGSALNSGDVNNIPVSLDDDGYNLLGNPYLTNINSGDFLTANTNLSGEIWLYNQATGNYETHVTGDDKILAPAQGFFVKATSGTDVDFTEAIQNTSTGTFQKAKTLSEIKLLINSEDTQRFAKIYFTEAATTGFDKGWDGERFNGISNKMDVFTQLLDNNTGKNYQTQSLPSASIESVVVPVGLISEAGKQITFSTENINLPENLNIFIEDRAKNIFTNLNESNYKITLSEALNGVGRFYIHTSAKSSLSVDTTSTLESVSIYKMNNATLRIAGLSQGKASVKLFNVLGKQMINTSFESNGVKDISLSKLATGLYIVQLETETGKLNKKIILE